ncbi:MAG TPA: 3-hydroxyacyl-CoA dehydrogenase [Geminicoccaceae bacterium]
MERIALVGGGLIGQAWAIVFGRAGHDVMLYDAEAAALKQAHDAIAARLQDLADFGLTDDPHAVAGRIGYVTGLAEALDGAAYVQESTPERVEVKREVYAELDRLAAPDAILASSTSGIPASAFTEHVAGRHRCLVAHPINPPFVTPLVELCPAPWTDPAVVDRTYDLMSRVGQAPIRLNKEVQGFVANRMQAALIGAAMRMVKDGVASAVDIDTAIKHGIGLRWSFMGPLETIDLNAPGGIADYLRRYGPLYQAIEAEHEPLDWTADALLRQVDEERRAALPAERLTERSAWRDRRLMALAAQKREAAEHIGE